MQGVFSVLSLFVDLSMCMPQILIRKIIDFKTFSFLPQWIIVNQNQYISRSLVEICFWQIAKTVECPMFLMLK